ncbi:hypothetical protein ACFL1Z_06785 [Thermodesulfobacteriota bacterium]
MKIIVNKIKCSGCHICELVCSLFHLEAMNPAKSAIRIQNDNLETSLMTPVLCRQCDKMICLDGEGIDAAEEKIKFIWDKDRAERCPFKALQVVGGNSFHCDLCGGRPQCVLYCTTGALKIKRS